MAMCHCTLPLLNPNACLNCAKNTQDLYWKFERAYQGIQKFKKQGLIQKIEYQYDDKGNVKSMKIKYKE